MRLSDGDGPHGLASVGDVIDRMREVSAGLPLGDGVRAFNEMYLVTTEHVRTALDGARFADPAFMGRLDVVFAGLFLQALATDDWAPSRVPSAWRALIAARARPGISQLQFAVAGMNAHINYDLPRALVLTAREFGGGLPDDGPRRADYLAINEVLSRTQPAVKHALLTGAFAAVDGALGEHDDRAEVWGIARAREFAWASGQTLWALRGTPVEATFTGSLDRIVGMSSKLLLTPG